MADDNTQTNSSCAVSIPANTIGDLLNGILSHFRQVETDKQVTHDRLYPEAKVIYLSVVDCFSQEVCSGKYTKANAVLDVEVAVAEVIATATTGFETAISNVVHEAAKYRIPKIITDMEASNAYEDSCAQLLMCDTFEALRNLKLEGIVNEAAQLALKNIETYSLIDQRYAETQAKLLDVGTRAYDNEDFKSNEEHSISSKAINEIAVIVLLQNLFIWILENIYNPATVKKGEVLKDALSACASSSDSGGGIPSPI